MKTTEAEEPPAPAVTSEGLVQLVLPEHDAEVVDGAGVELHLEDDVSGGVPVPLVVTLQLERRRKGTAEGVCTGKHGNRRSAARREPHQDVALQQQAGFDGDADAGVAVSLHVAARETTRAFC